MRALIFLCFGFSLLPLGATAASIDDIRVKKQGKQYLITSTAIINAPIDMTFNVLSDFDNYERISSLFVDSRFLTRSASGGTLRTTSKGCVTFFCKTIQSTEVVTLSPPFRIDSQGIAEQSDYHHYQASWALSSTGHSTTILYRLTVDPKFWVPPIIGPWAIKRTLRKDGEEALQRIEQIAQNLKTQPQ